MGGFEPLSRKIVFPASTDATTKDQLIKVEKVSFIVKLILALLFLIAGVGLIYIGIESATTLKFEMGGSKIELNTSLPGIVLAVLSLILGLFSRVNIKVTN